MTFIAIVVLLLYGCVDTHYNQPKEIVEPSSLEDDGAWLHNWVGLEGDSPFEEETKHEAKRSN